MPTITLELSDLEYQTIKKFAVMKRVTGNWMPDVDPFDAFMLRVIQHVEGRTQQKKPQKDAA